MKKIVLIFITLVTLSLFCCKNKKDAPAPSLQKNYIPYNVKSILNKWWVRPATKTSATIDIVNYQSNGILLDSGIKVISPGDTGYYKTGSSKYYIDSFPNSKNTALDAYFEYYTTNQYSGDSSVFAYVDVTYYNGSDTLIFFDTLVYVPYKKGVNYFYK